MTRRNCGVCGGAGWLDVADVLEVNSAAEVKSEIANPRVDWPTSRRTPCWACFPNNVKVLA